MGSWVREPVYLVHSAHGNGRNSFVPRVPGNSGRLRIEHWLTIHEETVPMVSVRQGHLKKPRTIHASFHWMRGGIPSVEIANQKHRRRAWCSAEEADRLGHPTCRGASATRRVTD